MTPCLRGAHKWAVVSSGKGQARSPHASTLTLNYSLQSREGLTAVVSLLDFLNSSWNWVCVWGGHSHLYECSTSTCLKGRSARTTAQVIEVSGREDPQAVDPRLGSSML